MKLLGRDSPTLWSSRRFLAKTLLVHGDRASVLGRLTATERASGQAISYRVAQFIQFRDKKVVDFVSIIDCFDAVGQCWVTISMRMTGIGSRATPSRCSC
jgi:ketosteroid isomerase-like protein